MYLSSKEARERMGVSRETLRKLINSGELTASKIGDGRNSPMRIHVDDIDRYMQAHRVVQPTP
jgi:excisionase family DNA binding protein